MSQFATFLLGAVNLLHVFPDHQSFLSPSAPRDVLAAAITQLVSLPSNSMFFLFFGIRAFSDVFGVLRPQQ